MWYISYLIRHAYEIREEVNDTLDDLIQLELDLESLLKEKYIRPTDMLLIKHFMEGEPTNLTPRQAIIAFGNLCRKLEKKVNPNLSDKKFFEKFRENYGLSKKEIIKVRQYVGKSRKGEFL